METSVMHYSYKYKKFKAMPKLSGNQHTAFIQYKINYVSALKIGPRNHPFRAVTRDKGLPVWMPATGYNTRRVIL